MHRKQYHYTAMDVAESSGVGERKVRRDASAGKLRLDSIGSVAAYISGKRLTGEAHAET